MRRWVCVIALLVGFAGDSYAWTVRPRLPVAIVRPIDSPLRAAQPVAAAPRSRYAFPLTGTWCHIA